MSWPTSSKQPLCVCCGKKIAKATDHHWFKNPEGWSVAGNKPTCWSREEAQRYVNHPIISIKYTEERVVDETQDLGTRLTGRKYVHSASTWDGESYRDLWFCNGTCRTKWAYITARKAWPKGYFAE